MKLVYTQTLYFGNNTRTRRLVNPAAQDIAALDTDGLRRQVRSIANTINMDREALMQLSWYTGELAAEMVKSGFVVYGTQHTPTIHIVTGSLMDAIKGDMIRQPKGSKASMASTIHIYVNWRSRRHERPGASVDSPINTGEYVVSYARLNPISDPPLDDVETRIFKNEYGLRGIILNLVSGRKAAMLLKGGGIKPDFTKQTLSMAVLTLKQMTETLKAKNEAKYRASIEARNAKSRAKGGQ